MINMTLSLTWLHGMEVNINIMSNKGIVDIDKLNMDMKSVADAIRSKSGNTNQLDWPQGFIDEIGKIKDSNGGGYLDPIEFENPNYDRPYSDKLVATFNNINDVDNFCNKFNYENIYNDGITKLAPGNRIQINDGVYNKEWVIAGFDCEYKRTAIDGTHYDNGYGIMIISTSGLLKMKWISKPYGNPYYQSNVHAYDSTLANNLKKVLGNHLINRKILVSSHVHYTDYGNGGRDDADRYEWTTAYCPLISQYNITGSLGQYGYEGKYDTGESNYKLPIFNHVKTTNPTNNFWIRDTYTDGTHNVLENTGSIKFKNIRDNIEDICPLIMIR